MNAKHATATTYLQADRYQPRPARKKKRGGCLPRLAVILLALAMGAGAAYLASEALMVAAGAVVVVGIPLLFGGKEIEA